MIWALNIGNLLVSQVIHPDSPVCHMPAIFRVWPARYPWKLPFGLLVLGMLSRSLDLHKTRITLQELKTSSDHVKLKPRTQKVWHLAPRILFWNAKKGALDAKKFRTEQPEREAAATHILWS